MSRLLIGSLVGGLLIFLWQFMSWSMLNVHKAEFKYTENQEAIITALNENLSEDGGYFIPMPAPDASKEEMEAVHTDAQGKPWAHINYHASYDVNMPMNMIRGYLVDVVAVFLLCWILMHFKELDMKTTVLSAMAVGVIGYLVISYTNAVWFEVNTIGHLIDNIVQWGLCGVWLGWWLNR
ncbi:MAG: hypothetical protein HKN09_07365 [Saprospiraceae bacterium]|nr:hypothetical protein [Saprospiraceae bacterium]